MKIPNQFRKQLPTIGYRGSKEFADFEQWAHVQGYRFQITKSKFRVQVVFPDLEPNDPWNGPSLEEAIIYIISEIIDHIKPPKK